MDFSGLVQKPKSKMAKTRTPSDPGLQNRRISWGPHFRPGHDDAGTTGTQLRWPNGLLRSSRLQFLADGIFHTDADLRMGPEASTSTSRRWRFQRNLREWADGTLRVWRRETDVLRPRPICSSIYQQLPLRKARYGFVRHRKAEKRFTCVSWSLLLIVQRVYASKHSGEQFGQLSICFRI